MPEPFDWRTLAADWFPHEEAVVAILRQHYPQASTDALHDAFVQGLLEGAQSLRYRPEQGTVVNFLVGCARRCLRMLVRSDTASRQRDEKKGRKVVADKTASARDVLDALADTDLAQIARDQSARTLEERRYLVLWEQGIDDPAQVARALGVEHLEASLQEAHRKRTHDRIMKRLTRLPERCTGEGPGP